MSISSIKPWTVEEFFACVVVTCTKFPKTDRIAPHPNVVFEVLSPDSRRRDRIEKLVEYAAVPSIRHYIIVESTSIGLTSFHRNAGERHFQSFPLTEPDALSLAGIAIEIPVTEFYEEVEFGPGAETAA